MSFDVIQILREELGSIRESFAADARAFGTLSPEDPAFMAALEQLSSLIERVGGAVGVAGFPGIGSTALALNELLMSLAMEEGEARAAHGETIATFPDLVLAYVEDYVNPDHTLNLIGFLMSLDTAAALPEDRMAGISEELAAGMVADEDGEMAMPERQKVAQPEDVSIAVSEETSPQLFRAYMEEAPGNAEAFSAHVQTYLANGDTDELVAAKRVAHTLKGSSHIAGIPGIGNVAHQLEDILEFLEVAEQKPPPHLQKTLLAAADCMESMIEAVQASEPAPANALAILQGVLDWANKLEQGDWSEPEPTAAPILVAAPAKAAPAPEALANTQETPGEAQPKPNPASDANSQLRVSARTMDEVLRLLGEVSQSVGRLQEQLKATGEGALLMRSQNQLLQQRILQLEELVTIRGVGLNQRRATGDPTFDPLEFDEYSELASITNALTEAATDVRQMGHDMGQEIARLRVAANEQDRLSKELQEKVLATRLLPVKEVVPRLQRAVRQTAQMTNKAAQLLIEGEEALIDSEVLNRLMDPLLHMLRNAVDHGIETPEVRFDAGKSEVGTIHLAFKRVGPNVVMTVSDDGPGLNVPKIRAKAIERGLLSPDHPMPDDEVMRLILLPGFSTRDQVTEVSGRGVGMDVVRERILALKGTLNISSRPGQGTHFEARIPASMLSVHALVVAARGEVFAIPSVNVKQGLASSQGRFIREGGTLKYTYDGKIYAAQELAVLVNHAEMDDVDALAASPAVIVMTEYGDLALAVEKIMFAREFLGRGLGEWVQSVRGVSAVSLLPDGTVIPLLDVTSLATAPADLRYAEVIAREREAAREAAVRVLVVDDSLSVRRTLAELLADSGFNVMQAADGVEAVEAIERDMPKIVLTDMEMPRMNGLELTTHLRRREDTQKLPVIMITSRSTQKHRDQAKQAGVSRFVTKPYSDVGLLKEVQELLRG
jgi:chemotaxis protein histidine kinase CheA